MISLQHIISLQKEYLLMTLYFTAKSIPALANYSVKERQEIINKAANKLTAPEKLIINLIKLSILVPMFLFIVWLDGWLIALPVILALVAYFFVYRPFFLTLIWRNFT